MSFLQRRLKYYSPASLQPSGQTILGTTVPVALERFNPIEEIRLFVDITVGASIPTAITTTQAGIEGLLNVVKNVNITYSDADGPHTPVNFSGAGLLALARFEGLNLDAATLETLRLTEAASIPANMKLRICYRIPFVRPRLDEPLRHRCLVPIHKLTTDPIMSLTFESFANMFSANNLAGVVCSYQVVYRDMSDALTAAIIKDGGFIRGDILETPFAIPVGSGAEVAILLPTGLDASIMNVLLRQYLGGASLSQDVIDSTVTLGQEERWRLDIGNNTWMEWRAKHLRTENDFAGVLNAISQTSSPQFGGAIAANTSYEPANVGMLDFMAPEDDGAGMDLGSCLDVSDTSKTYAIRVKPASVTPVGSVVMVGVRRLLGKVGRWQAINL